MCIYVCIWACTKQQTEMCNKSSYSSNVELMTAKNNNNTNNGNSKYQHTIYSTPANERASECL